VRAQLRARPPAHGPLVIVDSVPLAPDVAKDFALTELRFSGQEGDLVARAWPQAVRLRGADATFAAMRARLDPTPRLLHISSHAVTHGVVPSASLLLLADGAVPLSSLAELPLEGSTAVLSACSTAISGETRGGGEGDAGLLWGPLGAGARSVVASLWQVNQQATCDLMGQMHHWLERGESEAQALRRARQALTAAANYAHPHYWAGFAAFGTSATAARGRPWLWLGLALSGAIGFAWYRLRAR
jgi:CHAT domain-containing protein